MNTIPHLRIIIAFCLMAVAGYAIFSGWAVFWSADAALRGDVIGTWKSFAVAAFAFWLGSSSGGKTRPAEDPNAPSGSKDDPLHIEGAGKGAAPVNTTPAPKGPTGFGRDNER